MNFEFTPEQQMLRAAVRAYAEAELAPAYRDRDTSGEFPFDVWRRLADMEITGLAVSEANGGNPGGYVAIGIVAEELARGDHSSAYLMLITPIVGELLDRWGTDRAKKDWLTRFLAGTSVISLAVTESSGGSDAAAMRMKAVATPDGYRLTGEKSGVTMTMAVDALIVFARAVVDGVDKGITAFLVPMDAPGVSRHPIDDMGARSIGRGIVAFDDVLVPVDYRLGEEGTGFREVMIGFDCTRVILALMSIGAAMKSIEETLEYARQRTSFGRPLAANQGVQFPLAEHHTKLEMARLYCYYALWLRDTGRPHTREAAACKWIGPELSVAAIHDCMILHGHYGWTRDLPLELRLRDVIGTEIADGTPQIAKSVVARELLGRGFVRLDGTVGR
ncbi:acyl-CoA dehydrogenase family protein [Dactylosporangium sp. CA-092794]|uniref:acyl-CoA dehydrogenase family protein n=1 Tax=Dactylosporangium sp. CA-092794 TaxID=3239929 RepID=UPI003D8C8640